jgi:hypothetical protein
MEDDAAQEALALEDGEVAVVEPLDDATRYRRSAA